MAIPNLMTVEGLIKGARTLLLDKVSPYRYSDISLIAALNIALNEARRVRPDIFICRYGVAVPQYEEVSGEIIPVEAQFRLALEYGVVAHALMRDQEDVQDERSASFNNNFYNMLTGVRPVPTQGGTPTPSKAGGGKGGAAENG
jgi:hypothetical protein